VGSLGEGLTLGAKLSCGAWRIEEALLESRNIADAALRASRQMDGFLDN
jgi:hypothetical protein